MAHYCAECTYLDLSSERDGKFWCEKKLERHAANELECGRFCEAYSRSSSVSKSAYDFSEEKTSNGRICYLTTMICEILGLPDNNTYLETLRQFRKNVLQKDNKYKKLLVEYDIIGPKIANYISKDPSKKLIANNYFYDYIIPVIYFLNEGNIEKAIELYITMTNKLKSLYNLDNINVTTIEIDEADILESGHGKYVKKRAVLQ